MTKDAEKFLPHCCNERCIVRISCDKLRCRKLNNLKVSKDSTKYTFMSLQNDYSNKFVKRLIQMGSIEPLCNTSEGYESPFHSNLPFFRPTRHIPPTNPTNDVNMSPIEWYTFSVTCSMQNIQQLTKCGGVNEYLCKYIGNIDEQNYVIV